MCFCINFKVYIKQNHYITVYPIWIVRCNSYTDSQAFWIIRKRTRLMEYLSGKNTICALKPLPRLRYYFDNNANNRDLTDGSHPWLIPWLQALKDKRAQNGYTSKSQIVNHVKAALKRRYSEAILLGLFVTKHFKNKMHYYSTCTLAGYCFKIG